jgi:hypothetical protein
MPVGGVALVARGVGSAGPIRRENGIQIIKTPPQAPRANAVCERMVGTLRRELLDRILIVNRAQLRRLLPDRPSLSSGLPAPSNATHFGRCECFARRSRRPPTRSLRRCSRRPGPRCDKSPRVAAELVPLVAQIAAVLASTLNTLDDPRGTGRRNREALRALGSRLTAAADHVLGQLNR